MGTFCMLRCAVIVLFYTVFNAKHDEFDRKSYQFGKLIYGL